MQSPWQETARGFVLSGPSIAEGYMRADMFKVIVERPRNWKDHDGPAVARRGDFDGPSFLGMRAGLGCRSLNENLSPLRRFLHTQVGRPWNKVMSELRAGIDTRSVVKRHILEHIGDFVATNTWCQDGEIWYAGTIGAAQRLRDTYRVRLYVDPRTGILRTSHELESNKAHKVRRWRMEQDEIAARRRVLSATEQLLCIREVWYHVEVARLPEALPRSRRGWGHNLDRRWDAVRGALVSRRDDYRFGDDHELSNQYLFGAPGLYAVRKRQLGKRELRAAGLKS